ncbi:hypothetical protein M0802_011567 [Mischocyttarus mexicanus]|nr:hypothetical protein M0802_011567 [Mischocyttarus mexicanus]
MAKNLHRKMILFTSITNKYQFNDTRSTEEEMENEMEDEMEEEIKPTNFSIKTSYDIDKPNFCVYKRGVIIHSLKQYLSLINKFDGDSSSVEEFIRSVNYVLNLLSDKERLLFIKLVYAKKIIGEAKIILDQFVISTEESFFEHLRSCFKDQSALFNAKVLRNRCIQGLESALMYNNKFQRAQQCVLDAILNNTSLTIHEQRYAILLEEKKGLEEYLDGLNSNYKYYLTIYDPSDLNDAMKAALHLEEANTN